MTSTPDQSPSHVPREFRLCRDGPCDRALKAEVTLRGLGAAVQVARQARNMHLMLVKPMPRTETTDPLLCWRVEGLAYLAPAVGLCTMIHCNMKANAGTSKQNLIRLECRPAQGRRRACVSCRSRSGESAAVCRCVTASFRSRQLHTFRCCVPLRRGHCPWRRLRWGFAWPRDGSGPCVYVLRSVTAFTHSARSARCVLLVQRRFAALGEAAIQGPGERGPLARRYVTVFLSGASSRSVA